MGETKEEIKGKCFLLIEQMTFRNLARKLSLDKYFSKREIQLLKKQCEYLLAEKKKEQQATLNF